MQGRPRGRVYSENCPTTPGAWILLLSGTKKHSSVNWYLTELAANTAKEYPRSSLEKNQYLAREDTDHITNHVCPQYFKSKREAVTGQERGQNTNVYLQPWDDKQFGLKCPNWRLCAYTDGSCIGETENYVGTGVYCPQTKAECYVNSGGVGLTDTIHRAELTGFAAALTIKYTKIATESPSARLEKFFPLECNEPIYTQIC